MQIVLDDEQWTVEDGVSLLEILAQVSDKAYAKHRVVTSLRVGERRLTDRDLTGALLAQTTTGMGPLHATTQSMDQVMNGADGTMARYAGLLKGEAGGLVQAIRTGHPPRAALDAWLGRLADYLECMESKHARGMLESSAISLAPWASRLLDARMADDWVGLADLVEYEIMTRLPG